MKQLVELCNVIDLQEEVKEKVLSFYREIDFDKLQEPMDQLFYRETWDEGRAALKKAIGEDARGYKILTCMLVCGLRTIRIYENTGISEDILRDTLKCFTRFIDEHKVSYGFYGFDRDFWTPRQIAALLFRIGELEYELLEENGIRVVSIHIPSDADIRIEKVQESYDSAKEFLKKYFPEYERVPFVCDSWLLVPSLKQMLTPESKISQFQDLFQIEKVDEEKLDVLEWVFKRKDIPYEELPENTSLQRSLKKHLLSGGKVGVAYGRLREEYFIPLPSGNAGNLCRNSSFHPK